MMAKYGSNSLSVSLDNSGGTPVAMTAYITAINAVTVEALLEESHSFGDSWFESLATGMRRMSPVEISGIYDDTSSTGPDAVFNSPASAPSTSTRTLLITWGGSKTTSVETVITSFTRGATRNELTSYSVTLTPTGTVTEA
jgi:hypothetical protein